MVRHIIVLIILSLVIISCKEYSTENNAGDQTVKAEDGPVPVKGAQQEFLAKFSAFCEKKFEGKEQFRSRHGQSMAAKKMNIRFRVCDPDKVVIDFLVDQDPPISWILAVENLQLKLMHEHLDASGELVTGSMYGGVANDQGTEFLQYFPADEYTGKLMQGASENIWILTIAEDLSWFSYRLNRGNEPRLEFRFDLTRPMDR